LSTIKNTYQQFYQTLSKQYGEREAKSIARIVFEDAFKLYDYQSTKVFSAKKQLFAIQERLLHQF